MQYSCQNTVNDPNDLEMKFTFTDGGLISTRKSKAVMCINDEKFIV